jgi:aminoglycoside phosphotransferase (APT) family kinase protein
LPTIGGSPTYETGFVVDGITMEAGNQGGPLDITKLTGVLDWEMSTVGDPLMDLACTLSFWPERTDPPMFLSLRSLPYPETISRAQAMAYYMEHTGQRIETPDFYLCFGLFRRAVIEQQKYFRYVRGETRDDRFAGLHKAVGILREMCLNVINKR